MDDAVKHLEQVVTSMEKRIDTLSWKIKKFELVLFTDIEISESCRIMSLMTNLARTCNKYDELLSRVAQHKKEQLEFTESLQMHVNIVKNKVQTLRALVTNGSADRTNGL